MCPHAAVSHGFARYNEPNNRDMEITARLRGKLCVNKVSIMTLLEMNVALKGSSYP